MDKKIVLVVHILEIHLKCFTLPANPVGDAANAQSGTSNHQVQRTAQGTGKISHKEQGSAKETERQHRERLLQPCLPLGRRLGLQRCHARMAWSRCRRSWASSMAVQACTDEACDVLAQSWPGEVATDGCFRASSSRVPRCTSVC